MPEMFYISIDPNDSMILWKAKLLFKHLKSGSKQWQMGNTEVHFQYEDYNDVSHFKVHAYFIN